MPATPGSVMFLLLTWPFLLQAQDIEAAARVVYERIAIASGVSGRPPRLAIITEEQRRADRLQRRVAWFDRAANTIGIDRKTLELCAKLQDSEGCAAVLLGHELAHFYKDHRWGGDFGSRFANTDVGVQVRALDSANILIYETQADEAGGLYSYVAGYDALSLAPLVLDKIYAAYQLPPALPGYPSLAERKQIAVKTAARLETLIPLFESANLLLAVGRYESAGRCFDRVGQVLPGGAELNNAGVSYILEAAALFPRETNASAYPWTLDAQSRLERRAAQKSRGPSSETREDKLRRLVDNAESRFTEAIHRDPGYVPATLNLAFLEHLTGRRGTARDRLARVSVNQAGAASTAIEAAKMVVAADQPPALPIDKPLETPDQIYTAETIADMTPAKIPVKLLSSTVMIEPDAPSQETLRVSSKRYPNYWAIVVDSGSWHVRALVTAAYTGQSARHIHIGSPWEEALKAYAPALPVQQFSPMGRMAVFAGSGLAFMGSATVEKWMVFSLAQ